MISTAKKGAAKSSALGYIDAVEKEAMMNQLDPLKENIKAGTYFVEDLKASYKGVGPDEGLVIIKNGKVEEAKLCINKYSVYYKDSKAEIATNNYCSEEFKVILNIGDNKKEQTIKKVTETTFDINGIDISNKTNMSCNNGSIPSIENNTFKVSNIFGDTTCYINDTLNETVSNLDNTNTNIIMIKDETITKQLVIQKNNIVDFDINGKNIDSGSIDMIQNKGTLNIYNSSPGGYLKAESAVIASYGITNVYSGHLLNTQETNNGKSTIYLAYGSEVNVYGNKVVLDENNNYISGTYLKGNNNSVINIGKDGGTVNIYGGSFRIDGTITAIRSNFDTDNILINIYGGEISSYYNGVGLDVNCPESAIVNVYGGTIISEDAYPIYNNSVGTININQKDKLLYISTLTKNYRPAITNRQNGIINISGNEASECTNDSTKTTSGLCVYAEGDKTYTANTSNAAVANTGDGTININGGTYFGGYIGISNHFAGTINILDGKISSGNLAINVSRQAITNICKANISSAKYDLWTASDVTTGKINYSSSVIFITGTNTPNVGGTLTSTNIIGNYKGTCTDK